MGRPLLWGRRRRRVKAVEPRQIWLGFPDGSELTVAAGTALGQGLLSCAARLIEPGTDATKPGACPTGGEDESVITHSVQADS